MRHPYLSVLTAAAFVVAVLVGSASASAAQCPPGQTGAPPYCQTETPKPSAPSSSPAAPPLASTAVNTEVSGAVKVTVAVAGPGTLVVKGKAIKGETITVDAAGRVIVKLRATGKVLQHLENRGWTRRKQVFVTFTAADGTKSTIKIVVRFHRR
jgi:hypothetical protein